MLPHPSKKVHDEGGGESRTYRTTFRQPTVEFLVYRVHKKKFLCGCHVGKNRWPMPVDCADKISIKDIIRREKKIPTKGLK